MTRRAIAVFALVLAGSVLGLRAEDKPASQLAGTWERKVGDTTLQLAVKKDVVRFTLKSADGSIDVDADYGVTKSGTLFGIVTKVEKKGTDNGPSDGDLFSFLVMADKDLLTIKELKGTNVSDEARQMVEGEWKKVSAPEK
jgi:hypothetical protein